MIWLTWRQYRLEAMIGLAVLVPLALYTIPNGVSMANEYHSSGLAACLAGHSTQQLSCNQILRNFQSTYGALGGLLGWLNFLPLVFGILLGAPLILEIEHGTHRLAWTQSITRRRWLTTRLTLILSATIAVAVALTALITWWHRPLDQISGGLLNDNGIFDLEGTVFIAYSLFATALVLTAGVLMRKVIPAIAVSIGLFLVSRLGFEGLVRPNLVAPLTRAGSFFFSDLTANPTDWVLREELRNRLGQTVSDQAVVQACPPPFTKSQAAFNAVDACFRHHGFVDVIYYQPASRFWTFQAIETAAFAGVAAILLGITVWWVRYRVT